MTQIGDIYAILTDDGELLDTAILTNVFSVYRPDSYAKTSFSASPPEYWYEFWYTKENRTIKHSNIETRNIMPLKQYEEKYGK